MKILAVGGTRFFGRAFVEEAVRRGHEVSVFHRGESEPADLPDVEHLHGDRKDGLELLAGRTWDAVLDTCAFVPRDVRDLAEAIGDRVAHYTLGVVALGPPRRPPRGCDGGDSDPPAAVPRDRGVTTDEPTDP